MKMTKRIIIRIIVAVAVAFILSKLRAFSIMSVSALTATNNFTYENQIFDNRTEVYNFSDDFANGLERGTLKTNVTISSNILYASDTRLPVLRQAVVSNGSSNNVCSIGTLSNGGVDSFSSSGVWNERTINSQTYSIECEVTPNPTIKTLTLYFSGTLNTAYISFGPVVSFRENDLLLEMKKQNETCKDVSINSILVQGVTIFDSGYYDSGNLNRVTLKDWTTIPPGTYTLKATSSKSIDVSLVTFNTDNSFYNLSGISGVWKSIPFTFTTDRELKIKTNIRFNDNSNIVPNNISNLLLSGCFNKQDLSLEQQKEQTQAQQETNDYLKSDDHSEADSEGASFFNDFGGNNHGISGIVTAPLRLLNSLTTASCNPLTFPLPFVNEQITLPCMRGIYEQYFGVFFSLWQLITTGLISYNVSLNIYSKVRAMQNPNNDRIEVLNL